MNDTLQIIAMLIAALWWGGLVTIDFIETPSRFKTPNIKRDVIFAVGRHIFRDFGWVQLGYGVVLFLVVLLGGAELVIPVIILFMLGLTAVNVFWLEPTLKRIRTDAGELVEDTPEYERYQNFHRAFLMADVFKILLGGILVSALVMA